jgi:hypothetical protein
MPSEVRSAELAVEAADMGMNLLTPGTGCHWHLASAEVLTRKANAARMDHASRFGVRLDPSPSRR